MITTLICTYKRPELLKRTVQSVINQTYKNIKIQIIDDYSNDKTEEVIRELIKKDNRIKFEINKENIGPRKNFKYAFSKVETEYFSMLSDDDLLINDFYSEAIEILEKDNNIDFVIFESIKVDLNLRYVAANKIDNELKKYNSVEGIKLFYQNKIPHDWTAVVFKKSVADLYLKLSGGNDEGIDIRFMAYAIASCDFAVYSKYGAIFSVHKESETYSRPLLNYQHIGVMIGRYIEILEDENISHEVKKIVNEKLEKELNRNFKSQAQWFLIKKYIKSIIGLEGITKNEIEKNINEAIYLKKSQKEIFNSINKNLIREILKIIFKIILIKKIKNLKNKNEIMNKVLKEVIYEN
jgi:glycosyltransferase involved in cell wall biosynthesis